MYAVEALSAARTCLTYLRPGGYLRIAVPDGHHLSSTYLEWVRVGGAWSGQLTNDHKVLYTYKTLVALLRTPGFELSFTEYFDEAGAVSLPDWDPQQGNIRRSKRFDKLNKGGSLTYTSIVLDAIKPQEGLPISASAGA